MSTTKKMVVEWKGNLRLEAKNEKGLTVKFDAPKEHGGEETALSPMENVLASLASCSSFHVLTILKKKRLNVTGYSVEATAERRERTTQSIHKNPPQIHRKRNKHNTRSSGERNQTLRRKILLSRWNATESSANHIIV